MAESKYFPDLSNGVDDADVETVENAFTKVESDMILKADYSYVDTELAAKADVTDIPTKVSELENDSGYLTEHQSLEEYIKKSEAFDALCPRGSAEASGSALTLADCCGGTNIRNYVICGAEGGVGDLNADTGKYDIPVTVHGKNLLARTGETVSSGVTIKLGIDKWVLNGKQSGSNAILKPSTTQTVTLKPGTYTISLGYISGSYSDSTGNSTWIGLKNMSSDWITNFAVKNSNFAADKQATFTITEETKCSWAMSAVGTFSGYTFSMQLEKGDAATGFEPYTAPKTYTISLDEPLGQGETAARETGGDIALTDNPTNIIEVGTATAPSKIEAEYYKDINRILDNLQSAILSQGGNV